MKFFKVLAMNPFKETYQPMPIYIPIRLARSNLRYELRTVDAIQ